MSPATEDPPPAPKKFTETFAEYTKGDVTVILNASSTPHVLDSRFRTNSGICLIYSEKIEIKEIQPLPSKKLGLFCTELILPEKVVIDVSGKCGNEGVTSATADGSRGENGSNAGEVWVFVQDATKETMQNLEIKAYGGDGGKGGDSGAQKIEQEKSFTGGDGGTAGNGGNIEVLVGTAYKWKAARLVKLRKQPWPQQALALLKGTDMPDDVSKRLTSEDQRCLGLYLDYQQALVDVASTLNDLSSGSEIASDLKDLIKTHLRSVEPPEADALSEAVKHFSATTERLGKLDPSTDNTEAIKTARVSDNLVQTSDETNLSTILSDVRRWFSSEATSLGVDMSFRCHIKAGEGGQGGRSPNALDKPGKRGAEGKKGTRRVVHLDPKAASEDLQASQVFAFPDQCQMLLRQADLAFFSSAPEEIERAAILYRRILDRLNFLKFADFGEKELPPLIKAYNRLTSEWKMTLSPETTLRSIRDQAEKRLNKMYVGQDMWGHNSSWVPRMSLYYYDKELDRSLELLKSEEALTDEYEEAVKKGDALQRYVSRGIKVLTESQKAATEQIEQLTAENGPLKTATYKIGAFTPQLKEKKSEIRTQITKLQREFKSPPFDYFQILDALTTLAGCSLDFKSALAVTKKGVDIWKSTLDYKDAKYKVTNTEYIADEILTFDGDLKDLDSTFTTRKDHTIDATDPNSVKIIASMAKIKKLFEEYRNAFPKESRKYLNDSIDAYEGLVKSRNAAIMEYNSSIQLLFESIGLVKSLKAQADDLGQKSIAIDSNLPSVVHWFRRARDNLRLSIMQDLNNQSRAIRYWGLNENPPLADAMPLMNAVSLANERQNLWQVFRKCLERYAASVRNIWPRDDEQQGLFYKFSKEELASIKTSKIVSGIEKYTAIIRLDPVATHRIFGNHVDIRLKQVRLWLPGVDCDKDYAGRKKLTVDLIHMGDEIIQNDNRKEISFAHDRVQISFYYYVDKVSTIEEATSKNVFGTQQIEDNFTLSGNKSDIAAIGPFATWKMVISSDNNPGLNMAGVNEAYLEFRGTSRPTREAYAARPSA